jgi:protoporphyrinogen oxidase
MVEGRFHTVADPLRSPSNLFNTVNAPIGSLMDKIRIMALRNRAMQGSLAELFRKPESTTRAALEQIGFSRQMIEAFFEPWLGGIFLSRELDTSSRTLDFVIRMMATGRTSVPAEGMGRISDQLATNLDNTKAIRLNSPVAKVESGRLELADGEVIEADRIVLATEAPAVSKLLGQSSDAADERGVTCLYYTMAESPIEGPWLILDGDRSGPVNNVAIMSQVSAAYAPKGRELAAVTVLGADRRVDGELRKSVERQLRRWFGGAAAGWDFLKSYRIAHAQPAQPPGFRESRSGPYEPLPGVIVCGDHRETASINGAMRSGRHAGTIISRHLGLSREAVA